TDGSWAALSTDELRQRRAAYASRVATNIAQASNTLLQQWNDGFADEVRSAGSGSSVYGSTQAGLDALFASIFYVEKTVKDRKLAAPLGISPDCASATCPNLLESQYANVSLLAVRSNLQAFVDIYDGGPDTATDRFGFGDLLRASNASQLADDMQQALTLASSRAPLVAEPMSGSLNTQTTRDLYDAVQGMTTLLKTQFVSVLNLRVPNEGAADND
ncbi:MAG: imelysin family protein, partial [Myxococcota bacterium]